MVAVLVRKTSFSLISLLCIEGHMFTSLMPSASSATSFYLQLWWVCSFGGLALFCPFLW